MIPLKNEVYGIGEDFAMQIIQQRAFVWNINIKNFCKSIKLNFPIEIWETDLSKHFTKEDVGCFDWR